MDDSLILVAEDDVSLSEVVTEVLESEGFVVRTARSALEVIAGLYHQPAIVMLDVHGVSSPEVIRAIRLQRTRPHLLLVSGDRRLPDIAERLHADAHLLKPYDIRGLLDAVHGLLRQRALLPKPDAA